MFQKPTFGANTSGFGSFNTGASTSFGGFKSTTGTGAFGAPPAFGATAAPNTNTGGGLFGATSTSGGLFGGTSTAAAAPAFGASSSGFGFGANTTGTGLFTNNTSGGLFGANQNTSAFGAKPAGFGFGGTQPTGAAGGLFGAPAASTGLFGQTQNNAMTSGGLFANTGGGFGQQQATGTAHAKYNPVVGTDVVVKSGNSQSINIKHHCITCMKEYEGKSLEELRLEDYTAGRKGATAGVFTGFSAQEAKPLFGGTTFGQPATTSAPSVFGGSVAGGFGQGNTFSFGGATAPNQTNSTYLFAGSKPGFGTQPTAAPSLFGTATTQANTFGTSTSNFGFGATTQNQSGGLFGSKPPAFGAPASSGFGAFGATAPSGGLFAKPQQTTAPTFGSTAPAFGALGGFGTSTSAGGSSLFGSTFKPATTQPTFGFGSTQPTGLGLGSTLGANSFQAKPAAPGFGQMTGSLFAPQNTQNTFKTGTDSGLGTLGGGLFNTSALGGSSLGTFNANNSIPGGGGVSSSVHEQILTLAARPYGDEPLFKDLLPDTSHSMSDMLKPTNPAAVRAVLEGAGGYRVSSPPAPALRVRAAPLPPHRDKKSLFEGLEESDSSLEDKLSLRPSRKRLVLRPTQRTEADRSVEEPYQQEVNGSARLETNKDTDKSNGFPERLSESKISFGLSERPVTDEPTPKIYPDLDKELPSQEAERRASWLNSKPFRKPLGVSEQSVESSVRELGVRSEHHSDKENIDNLSLCSEETAPGEVQPHPTGVRLTRPGYYTIPSLDDMIELMKPDGSCPVPHLTIGRKNYGNVYYDCEIDVAGLDLDTLVHFLNKEVIVYPEDADKPPVGEGLNRRAIVTLDRIWPRDKTEKRPITDPERLLKMDYEGKLRRVCDKHDTKFIEYRPQTGSWVFRVEHFSKYGLTESDEEEEPTPDVLKRQLVTQTLLKHSPVHAPVQEAAAVAPGLGGLGGLALAEDSLYAMHQTSLNLLNGVSKAFHMDTTEDNAESQSLYPDTNKEMCSAGGVLSPTGELARLERRSTHRVQLMKASLYADTEMDEGWSCSASVSTEDQLVPAPRAPRPPSPEQSQTHSHYHQLQHHDATLQLTRDEVVLPPLVVRPHTVVLQYNRKIPPFKQTTAGRLDAACIADMSVCRARHSRVGFGPGGVMVFPTTYNAIHHLPTSAPLNTLEQYVAGRGEDDWSEPVVVRLAIGHTDSADMEPLRGQLEALLEHSELTESGGVPALRVRTEPARRAALLRALTEHARRARARTPQFGMSGEYQHQVWKLCEALWAADLENDGVPGTDVQAIVERHSRLLDWLTDAAADVTDRELAAPTYGEPEDENDGHSARVWTLLAGGRILEACKLARQHQDLNMATLIAQAAGDDTFRSLVARQVSVWRGCGALPLVAGSRLAALQLLAGLPPTEHLHRLDWVRALQVTARYICPQVPSLERIIRTYEDMFGNEYSGDEVDLTVVTENTVGMHYPTPPYVEDYEVNVYNKGGERRVLDLRYCLLRARALHTRPRLRPAACTPDPLDYSLTFVLGAWLGTPSIESIVGVSEQLEARGAWQSAVQALLYHPDDNARRHLVRGVVARGAGAVGAEPALRALRLPGRWLRLAQAHRAKYQRLPTVEVEHLIAAGQWNEAHRVLLKKLLPEAVLADNLESISPLLEKLSEAAARHEVSGWERGGQALYHYIHVCDEIRTLSSSSGAGGGEVAARLDALRPRLAAACRALAHLPANDPVSRCARTEMGARLVQASAASGLPPARLAALLRALRLPPDCAHQAHTQIMNELAERAAEGCGEVGAVRS